MNPDGPDAWRKGEPSSATSGPDGAGRAVERVGPVASGSDPDGAGPGPYDQGFGVSADDVGAFDQGNELSRWALARYIVGRVILERVSWALLGVVLLFVILAVAARVGLHSTALMVILIILALGVLLMRALLRAVLKRLMAFDLFKPYEDRVSAIVNGASQDIFAEMARVGLPSHIFTLPLIIVRLIGRRRKETLDRMKNFEVERAVPRARRDELHMVLREATGRQ